MIISNNFINFFIAFFAIKSSFLESNSSASDIKSILFVCLGNICRSPLAEGIARDIVNKNNLAIKISSCGTSSFHEGEPPHSGSISVAKKKNIDISKQRSRPISNKDKDFSLIIAMDETNKRDILNLGFDKAKVFKLGEFDDGLNLKEAKDIPDPYYYKDLNGFEEIYNLIEELMIKLFKHYGLIK